ncbi:enhanced serine sensitivity protein SseB C-terminal domain-containing protein [Dyella sp. 20L07]|uniref:enhanced serine sensitivity protein SseB C-terminal domain-containing protein n=1 Tax=Dyella sp. 20L07 TaxID=3384240 RepID=UPI003D2758F7
MTTRLQLQSLLTTVRNNPLTEPQFFEALLDATVYAHVPIHQVPGRLRFIQFIRPDNGQTVLPFFSDQAKAQLASSDDVSIIAMDARQLFELTRGATLMLDPNDDRAVLYPEEISALLSGKPLVAFGMEKLAEPETVGVRAPTVPIEALTSTLKAYCETEPDVAAAYIVEILRGRDYKDATLLVAIAARGQVTERVNRTSMQRIQPLLSELALPLLMTVIDPDEGSTPFYQKAILFYSRP